jgi:hypothetical protein
MPKTVSSRRNFIPLFMITTSTWAETPIQLTEGLGDAVWAGAGKLTIPGGFLVTKNDAQFLYAALDMISDTGNDSGVGDYFWFTFDKNRSGNITPNVDVNYGQFPNAPNKIGRQFYLGAGTWTGLSTDSTQFKSDFEPSPNNPNPHRVWKFRFKLTELNVSLVPAIFPPYTRFGLKIHSTNPASDIDTPANFWTNFTSLHTLYFSRKPTIDPALMGPVMGCVGLIPTTKINASGRATTDPAYFIAANNAAFGGRLNIIGNKVKLDALLAAGARYIKIKYRPGTSGSFSYFRTAWYNYSWNVGLGDYELQAFGPDAANFHPLPLAGVDYSIHDLLFQFDSYQLTQGIHQFELEFFNAAKVAIATPAQTLTLNIDNTVPEVKINSVKHGAATVDTCAIVQMNSLTDGIVVNFNAFEPEGNLLSYSVTANWGDGQSASLSSDSYTPAKGNWTGVQNQNAPGSGVWVPIATCAHSIDVGAYSRTTNGYGYIHYNSVRKYITIIK